MRASMRKGAITSFGQPIGGGRSGCQVMPDWNSRSSQRSLFAVSGGFTAEADAGMSAMVEHPVMPQQLAIAQQGKNRFSASGRTDGDADFLGTARFMLAIACAQCRIPWDGVIAVAGNESVVPTTITRRTAATRLGRSPNVGRMRAM